MTHHLDLDTLTLAEGAHESRDDGVCLLEAVAWWADEVHTDHPACVSPVLGAFGRCLNDMLPAAARQELRPLIPLLPGTAGDGRDEARGYLALDWLVRTYTPAWLDLAALTGEAQRLRGLAPLDSLPAAEAAGSAVRGAQQAADTAVSAAGAAAVSAAGAAAWDTARAAEGDAEGDAAGAAAGAAAWDAAVAAAVAAARDAAGAAAWAAAGDAAWDAAWAAEGDAAGDAAVSAAVSAAWAAAGAAAVDALAPTVAQLQSSAISLFRTMAELRPLAGAQ